MSQDGMTEDHEVVAARPYRYVQVGQGRRVAPSPGRSTSPHRLTCQGSEELGVHPPGWEVGDPVDLTQLPIR